MCAPAQEAPEQLPGPLDPEAAAKRTSTNITATSEPDPREYFQRLRPRETQQLVRKSNFHM